MTPEEQLYIWLSRQTSPLTFSAIAAQAAYLHADMDALPIQWIWPADDALWGWYAPDQPQDHRRWGFVL